MGALRCCLILHVAALLLLLICKAEARLAKYDVKHFDQLQLDMESWDPEVTYTEEFSFVLLELWWTPQHGTDSACNDLQLLAGNGSLTVMQCAPVQHGNQSSGHRALIASTEVTSPQLIVSSLIDILVPAEASVLVKVNSENYALMRIARSQCLDLYRIFNLDFKLSLELLSEITFLMESQAQLDRHCDLMLDSSSSAVYLHCSVHRASGRSCTADQVEGPQVSGDLQRLRMRRQAGSDPAPPSGPSAPAAPPGDPPASPSRPSAPPGDSPASPSGPSAPAAPPGDSPASPSGPSAPAAPPGDSPASPSGPSPPAALPGDPPASPSGPSAPAAPPGDSPASATGSPYSVGPQPGSDVTPPADLLPPDGDVTTTAVSIGHKFNCPYLTTVTRRKFTILLSVSDLAARAELDGLSNEQVVSRVDRALQAAFNASSFAFTGRYNPLVNRILIGSHHLVVFVSVEKDQQLRPGHPGARFELPTDFLSSMAAVWTIDIAKSAFSSIDVKMPVRDICDIYKEISTCPYIKDNKERIRLQVTIDLAPFFSRDLISDRVRLNNSVEVLVHYLLENGNHYHTKHHQNNVFDLEVIGQKVMVAAQLDLWITAQHERHPNSTELAAVFLHNLKHYMDTHSPGDVFFLRLIDVEITVLPIVIACMDYLQEVAYTDRKYFSYSAGLRLRSPQAHLREASMYFTTMCETSLLHRLPFLKVDGSVSSVPNEYHNMVLLSNVSFAPDRDGASLDIRMLFRVNSGQPGDTVIKPSVAQFLNRDEGFNRWLGIVDDSSGDLADEKPIFRTVKYKYKKYFGESKRLLVTKLRFTGYTKRLCGTWFAQQIIQKAYYYTSRNYYNVDHERDFELDHFDEDQCKSQTTIEFTAIYTLSSFADPVHAWKRSLVERELLEGLKFIFPDMDVKVLQTSINAANVKFDKMRRRVQQQVSLTALPALVSGGARPKSDSWVANYAAAGLRLWLATGYLQAREDDRIFSIEGVINVTDIVADSNGVAFKATYTVRSSREATWSSERLARLFREGFVSREYKMDAMQIRLNRVPERSLFVVKSAAGCPDTAANSTIVFHREAVTLSKEDLRHWSDKNASALLQDTVDLIKLCYMHGDSAKLRASGFRVASPDSVEGATFVNLDAQIVDNQLQFRTQYTIETANPVAFELSADNARNQFRTGLMRHASRLNVQGPAMNFNHACDDCVLEVACQPRIDELQSRAYSVRRMVQMLKARVSPRVWAAAADSVPVRELISHWFRVLYLDYFLDSLRVDSQPPIYTYIPYDCSIPVDIKEDRQLITLSYILTRDSKVRDTGFKSKLFWREEDFTKNFLDAFRAFNEVTGIFTVDAEPQTDIEFYQLLPPQGPVMVVSPKDKVVILNVKDLDPAKCTDAVFREKLYNLSSDTYLIPKGSNVEAVQDRDSCMVRFNISAANPADVDSNTWSPGQLRQFFLTVLTGELAKFSVATVDKRAPCAYCEARRRVFVNIEAQYNSAAQIASVEFLTVQNYAEKRRHLVEDHLVPAFDPARRSQQFLGRRHYQLDSLDNAEFDFRKVGDRERYSVIFDATIVPSDASWSEYHLRKLFTGWMSSQNSQGGGVTLSGITVHILDPVEMSEYVPPPRVDVYTAMVNMTMPLYLSGSGDAQQMIRDTFNMNTQIFTLDISNAALQLVNQTKDDGSQLTLGVVENCQAKMRIQLPQLLTKSAVIRTLQTGFNQLPSGGAKDTMDIDFKKMEVSVFYNSTALPKSDCLQTSRRVKFLLMLNLLNTPGNRAIANVSGGTNFTFQDKMIDGIRKLVEHNVLDYYGLDVSITGDNAVEILYRSTSTTGLVQVDYNLISIIPGFKWIRFVQATYDILNRISLRTSYDGHQYHDVMQRIGYVQFRGVPTTHVYDRCSSSKKFKVLQTTSLGIVDRDQFQRLGYFANPVAAVHDLVNFIYTIKLSGMQIYSIVPNSTVLHRHRMIGDTTLEFTVSYTLVSGHRFNIAEYILSIFNGQMLNRISDVFGLVPNDNNSVEFLDVKQDGVHCVAKIATVSDRIATERIGCFPVLDASLTVGACAKPNPHAGRQVPVKHNFVLLAQRDFVYGDVFPRNDPEARAVIEYLLALTFDDRITPGISLTWDPTFSGETSLHVSFQDGLKLTVETYYILLKSTSTTGSVTAAMVEAIFNANIGRVLAYFGTGSIRQSVIQIWSPDCSHHGGSNSEPDTPGAVTIPPVTAGPQPDQSYLGQTGIVRLSLTVSVDKNYEIASLTAEPSYARFTFSKWLRQVFDRLPYRLLNTAYSNLLTGIDAITPDPSRSALQFGNLRVDLGTARTPPQALADAFAEAAGNRGGRFIVAPGVLANLRVSAEFAKDSARRRRSAPEQPQPQPPPQPTKCPTGIQSYNQVRITISLQPQYSKWFVNENRIGPVLGYLLKRSLLEALNFAELNASLTESQVIIGYISPTSQAVALQANVPRICPPPDAAAPAAVRRRFYASWSGRSVTGRLLQERLVGLAWRLAPADGWKLLVYKSLLLDHWPWSDSFADRLSLQRLRLTAKLLGILQLVYNAPSRIHLRGFDFDVQRTEAGVRVFLFEDLALHGSGATHQEVEAAVRDFNVRREADIRRETPLLMSPFNMTHLFLKVLHIEPLNPVESAGQQLQQTKFLMVTFRPRQSEAAAPASSDLDWIERIESALGQHQQQQQQPYIRVFHEPIGRGPQPEHQQRGGVSFLASVQCNSSTSAMAKCQAGVANAVAGIGSDVAIEFLFSDIALHIEADKPLPVGATDFLVNHTAVDEADDAMTFEQRRLVPEERLKEFWINMLIHIVCTESFPLSVTSIKAVTSWSVTGTRLISFRYQISVHGSQWSADSVRQFILDRFDLWNLLFPYSNIRSIAVDVKRSLGNWWSHPASTTHEHTTTATPPTKAPTKPAVHTVRPHVTTDRPHITTDRPHITTDRPHVTTDRPHVTTDRPHVTTDRPHVTTDRPHVTTDRPHVTTDRPHVTTERPHVTTERPHFTTDGPHFTTDRPHFTTDRPHFTTDKPHVTTDRSHVTTAKPHAITTAQSVITTTTPVITTSKLALTTPNPIFTTARQTFTTIRPTDTTPVYLPTTTHHTGPLSSHLRVKHICIVEIRSLFKNWKSNGTESSSVAATEILKETIRESYYFGSAQFPYRLQVLEENFELNGMSDATLLQFTAEYTLAASKPVTDADVLNVFGSGWDQRKLKNLLPQTVLNYIMAVPTIEAASERQSAIVYLFTVISTAADNASTSDRAQLARTRFTGLYEHTQLAKLHHFDLQLTESYNRSVLNVKLLLDIEVNSRGNRVSEIVSFETHSALMRIRSSHLRIMDGFFAHVMHSVSFDRRQVLKSAPLLVKVRMARSDFMFDPQNPLLTALLEYQMTKKLEIAFNSKRSFAVFSVKIYSVDKLASGMFSVCSITRLGLLSAAQDRDSVELLSQIRSAYDVVHLYWPMNAFASSLPGPAVRVMNVEHQLQMSGLNFAGDAAAAEGAQFSREFTRSYICDCIGFIYSFDTPSAVNNCSSTFALGADSQVTVIHVKYTVSFSAAESSLFDLTTLLRVFDSGLKIFNAEFNGGHPVQSVRLSITGSFDLSRTRASQLNLDIAPPTLLTPEAAKQRMLAVQQSPATDPADAEEAETLAPVSPESQPMSPPTSQVYVIGLAVIAGVALLATACCVCLVCLVRRQLAAAGPLKVVRRPGEFKSDESSKLYESSDSILQPHREQQKQQKYQTLRQQFKQPKRADSATTSLLS